MQKLSCYIYKEGRDFVLTPELDILRHHLSLFALKGEDGELHPHPDVFEEVNSAQKAVVFIFPFDLVMATDQGLIGAASDLAASLPYFQGREERHIFTDHGDFIHVMPHKVCLFKVSVTRSSKLAERAVVPSYDVPEHILSLKPEFNVENIKYDSSFVGMFSNIIRNAAVRSIQVDAPELRFFERGEDRISVENGAFFLPEYSPEEIAERQARFIHSIRYSTTVICPPGVGPQSIRFYETMYLGRIPVTFGDNTVYPFEDEIDYSRFCLHIPQDGLMRAGPILRDYLAGLSPDDILARWILACKTWHKYFSPEQKLIRLMNAARKKFDI